MKRLGIVVSHPVQYYSPLFRHLAKTIDLMVFYCYNPSAEEIGKDGFGIKFQWDVDLLSGYPSIFLHNFSSKPSLSSFNGCNTPDVGTALKEHNITHLVIMGWYLKSYIQALFQAKKSGLKVAVRGDSQLNPTAPLYKRFLKRIFYRFLLARYDKLFYVGIRNKAYLLFYGAKQAKLIFAPHAIDQSFWQRGDAIPADSTKKKTIFIWIGKFIEIKRPYDAINSFLMAYGKDPLMELWMIGSGNLMESSITLANKHPAIKFEGFKNQTELRAIVKYADVLLLTSTSETWGLVVNECFSMGLPAIVSDTCGCGPDLIEEGKTGYTFKMGNCIDLAKKMELINKQIKTYFDFKQSLVLVNSVYSYDNNTMTFKNFLAE